MKKAIDLDAFLEPIEGENPAGEDLRYTPLYEEIKEARKEDDLLDLGDWQREIKRADWDKAIGLSSEALSGKTKDLQIAAWLTEALIRKEGFDGLTAGLRLVSGLIERFWDHLYPTMEEGDMEYRAAPIEFMNEKLWLSVKDIPMTDEGKTNGYSWLKWKESRDVGYEADLRNRYGDVDENKKKARDERIAEGKLTAEDFDAAVAQSSKGYYESLAQEIVLAHEEFTAFDRLVDEKFGAAAPRLAELRGAIEDCEQLVSKLVKEKGGREPAARPQSQKEKEGGVLSRLFKRQRESTPEPGEPVAGQVLAMPRQSLATPEEGVHSALPEAEVPTALFPLQLSQMTDTGALEKARWQEAVETLENSGMKEALDQLLAASFSAPSVRDKNRYRLLMAKMCLRAERPDLARPIVEELHGLIDELHLERWESPVWIAEVLDALYQCLTTGEVSDEDMAKARTLFQRLCTTDVTKAMLYRS
jgi:type VI secretion system protein ImpA